MTGSGLVEDTVDDVEVEAVVRAAPPAHHLGGGERGDVAVQGVGRLEQRPPSPGPAVGEQQALEHLVGPVGAEHLRGSTPWNSARARAQRGRVAVGVAVEVDAPQLVASARRATPAAAAAATRWC